MFKMYWKKSEDGGKVLHLQNHISPGHWQINGSMQHELKSAMTEKCISSMSKEFLYIYTVTLQVLSEGIASILVLWSA